VGRIESMFNEKGLETEYKDYDENDQLILRQLKKYNGTNELIEVLRFDSSGVLKKKKQILSENLRFEEKLTLEVDTSFYVKTVFKDSLELDGKGNWIRKIFFEDDMPVKIIERTIQYFDEE
jgi:hypothetical protein